LHSYLKRTPKIVWLALLTFVVGRAFSYAPALTEKVYTQGIYVGITSIISRISNLFPFSLDDMFYVFLLLFFLTVIIRILLKKMKLKKGFVLLGKSLLGIYILFYWLWGFNYYRQPLNVRIQKELESVDSALFYETLNQIIQETNQNYCAIQSLDKTKINQAIEHSYQDIETRMPNLTITGKRRPKSITFSRFFSGATVFGYFGPFAHETHVNKQILPVQYPFVLAHEKAHQMGITSEAEANFMAWLACKQSPIKELKYSANLYVFIHFLRAIPEQSQREKIMSQLQPEILNQLEDSRTYWNALRIKFIDRIQSKLYDLYLKGNDIPQGIQNYQEVVTYICTYKSILNTEFKPITKE
jgi:hypothetical protein